MKIGRGERRKIERKLIVDYNNHLKSKPTKEENEDWDFIGMKVWESREESLRNLKKKYASNKGNSKKDNE